MVNQSKYKCPKCGCEQATRVPIELMDGIKGLWYFLIIASLLGVVLSHFFILICIVLIIITIGLNIIKKVAYRNEWIMQCSRCGTEYKVINPDMAENAEKSMQKKAKKNAVKQEKRINYMQIKKKAMALNGMLGEDEHFVTEIKDIGLHKNAFTTRYGNIKVTDKSLIYYNGQGSLRIMHNEIQNIRKHNYILFIPTGIQIVTSKRKINLVLCPSQRDGCLESLLRR